MKKACGMVYPTSIADACMVGFRPWINSFEVESIEMERVGVNNKAMTGTTINGAPFRAIYPEWQFKPYDEKKDDEQDLNECIGAPEALIAEGVSKYHREIKPGVFVDVYDVLAAWNVTNPALQHLIKKALQPGARGHKTTEQDMQDIIDSAIRAKKLETE